MKHLNKILIAVLMIMGLNAHAQDSKNPWAVSFGINAIDTKTSAGGGNNWLDGHFSKAFAVKDNWNILPSISYVSVSKYVGDNFSVGISGSINKLDKYVTYANSKYSVSNPGGLMYCGIDAVVRYSLKSVVKSNLIEPSVSLGIGYSVLGDNSYQTVSPGADIVYWFSDSFGLELATKYVKSYESREINKVVNAPSMLQHSLGIKFKFGEK